MKKISDLNSNKTNTNVNKGIVTILYIGARGFLINQSEMRKTCVCKYADKIVLLRYRYCFYLDYTQFFKIFLPIYILQLGLKTKLCIALNKKLISSD